MVDFKKMFCAGAALLFMAACGEEEVLNTQTESAEGQSFMSLSIEMPNLGTSTRSINEGTAGTHAGTEGEQQVSELMILVYNENGSSIKFAKSFNGSELIPVKPAPEQTSQATVYTTPVFSVASGKSKVVVVVNPLKTKFPNMTNLSVMGTSQTLTEKEIQSISAENHFMMTNANKVADGDGAVAVDIQGTQKNPTVVTVEVERVVAKIEEKSDNYSFTLKDGSVVRFIDVALINGNTKFFPIKKVRANAGNAANDYIVDPNFENQKATSAEKDFYSASFAGGYPQNGAWCKALQAQTAATFYTLENTMIDAEQLNAYTTGLYYKAVYTLKNAKEGDHVFEFAGKLYSWAQLQAAAPSLGLNLSIPGEGTSTALLETSSQADFDKVAVKKYEKGICYYPYWIRHIDNNDPSQMGAMEFAVVRNNYYQMNIRSVKGIGEYKPVNPDPSTPDEGVETFLDVKVKVLPWIVRKNQIDF